MSSRLVYGFLGSLLLWSCTQTSKQETSNVNLDIPVEVQKALDNNGCNACHQTNENGIGPSFSSIVQLNYSSAEEVLDLIRHPKPERWPDYRPMMPVSMSQVDGETISRWIYSESKN